MAIKKLTVSFDLPIATFLSMLAAGNSGLKIDVYGDDHAPRHKRLNGHVPPLLEGPTSRKGWGKGVKGVDADGKPINGRTLMLKHLADNKDRHVRVSEFDPLLKAVGLKGGASSTIFSFRQHGWIKQTSVGHYSITAKGLSEYAKREAANGEG